MKWAADPAQVVKSKSYIKAGIAFISYSALSAFLFTIYAVILGPLFLRIDVTSLAPLRGPVLEELFKYTLVYFIFRHVDYSYKIATVGVGVGLGETAINTLVVFEPMWADMLSVFPELSYSGLLILISIGVFIKGVTSCLMHYLFIKIGVRLFKHNLIFAYLISVLLHLSVNLIVSP